MRVEWHDAATEDGWTDEKDIDPAPPVIVTVGHLQHSDRKSVVIALSWDEENENFSSWITIPRKMIISQVELVPKKPKR